MDELSKVLMSFSFEKLLSPEALITSAGNSQGNPQIGIKLLKRLFMNESEELKSCNLIQRQTWQVFDLHNQLLSNYPSIIHNSWSFSFGKLSSKSGSHFHLGFKTILYVGLHQE